MGLSRRILNLCTGLYKGLRGLEEPGTGCIGPGIYFRGTKKEASATDILEKKDEHRQHRHVQRQFEQEWGTKINNNERGEKGKFVTF